MSDVLPRVLSAELVAQCSDEALSYLQYVTTDIVMMYVNEFFKRTASSSDPVDTIASEKLKKALKNVIETQSYLESEETRDFGRELAALSYSDISYNANIEDLKRWRSMICELFADDATFKKEFGDMESNPDTRGMKIAFTPKMGAENLDEVLLNLKNYALDNHDVNAATLATIIEHNKSIFKYNSKKESKPTVLRNAIYNKDRLFSIMRGLNFLIPRMEKGVSPSTWRKC